MSSLNRFTTGIAALALLALPASGVAQTPPSQPPTTQPPATSEPQPPAAQTSPNQTAAANAEAKEHLVQARTAIEGVHVDALSASAKAQVAELKRHIDVLERTIDASANAAATGTENRTAPTASGSQAWGTEVAGIDKALTALLGAEATTGAATPTGTTGTTAKGETLDEPTRAKLLEVRTHITAFATAMAGGKTTPSAQPTTEPSANPAGTTPPATNPPTTEPQPTGTTGTTQTQPPATQMTQPDEQLARKHLTDARNTLSELTQLPAASQLSGETRTLVSQLISNFNELITTQAEWRAAYAKVNANLTALIGPDPAAADPSSTAAPVGTSGTAASLDTSIRERLVTLRRQLTEFEKAAGGSSATPSRPPTEDPAPPATAQPTTPPTSAPPSTTPPSTPPPSTTPPSTTPPTSQPETAPPSAQGMQATGNADLVRRIGAIEALLKAEDDSGGLTLTKAQLEQLRTHLTALRQGLDKK